ncbi:MAG: hypothetical protein Q4Q04_04605, partial [Methanocorpusculum sp.]|nr:hypothetical protein [Methanocorpusculum sp.]
MQGNVFAAMRENGRLVSQALCISTEPADRAIAAGAAAAGLSGTGPATGILVLRDRLDGFLENFGEETCIITGIRNTGAS